MKTYSIGALIKFTIGLIILSILYRYVNVYDSPILGLAFGYLGVFMLIRGMSYFLFLGLYKVFAQNTSVHQQTSFSYKLSLLFGICIMTNLTLMINGKWSTLLGGMSIIAFIIFIALLSYDKTPTN